DTLQSVPVLPAFHSGPVTSMDVCVRKPLAVTCSADKSVRIWNFVNFTCELCKYFPEEPLSISMHPSGYYLLVGFADKLRLYTIIPDDLRTLHEFPIRGCRECAFARGGHQFAAVQGPLILIFNAWTFEQVATLKAHNGRVRSLYWTRGTHGLISCGADGAVYTWELLSGVLRGPAITKRVNEYIHKGVTFTSAIDIAGNTFAVGSDRVLRSITDSLLVREVKCPGADLTQIAVSQSGRMMFV
ncbi:WD40-repeat-containing domain protein, partial [Blastocladiella britannica]